MQSDPSVHQVVGSYLDEVMAGGLHPVERASGSNRMRVMESEAVARGPFWPEFCWIPTDIRTEFTGPNLQKPFRTSILLGAFNDSPLLAPVLPETIPQSQTPR